MSTIQNLFQQAQLAEAAYANFLNPGIDPIDALQTGGSTFSLAQATAFVAEWQVVDQYTAPGSDMGPGSQLNSTPAMPPHAD